MLEQTGEVTVTGNAFPVFQCDDCLVMTDFLGESMELPYTFALDAAGTPFDPNAEGGESLN